MTTSPYFSIRTVRFVYCVSFGSQKKTLRNETGNIEKVVESYTQFLSNRSCDWENT
jgi:hypothetical protein